MTRIEEMTEPQRQSWITFLADGAVFIWFWKNMTGGFNLSPRHFEPAELGAFFLKFFIVTLIVHGIIASVFEIRKKKSEFEKDERDTEIARRGSHAGYSFFYFGIGVVVVTLILQYVIGADYQGPISVINPVEMVFALCVVSFLADLYRHGTIIWAYRA